tara:strand:+ start:404 stop:1438 length:1035 start_codon:yes stop_codon:yes gene_type:complete
MNYEKHDDLILPPDANLKLPVYNNSRFFYNNKAKELVLDIVFNTNNDVNKPKEFNLTFPDPLHIDVEHDIYLDSVITFNLKSSKMPQNMAFLIYINEFNIQTKTATNIRKTTTTEDTHGNIINTTTSYENRINRSIVIPNEKSHETVEIIKPKSGQLTGGQSTATTIMLTALAAGSSIQNYYQGKKIFIHLTTTDNHTFTLKGDITGNDSTATPTLQVANLVDVLTDAAPDFDPDDNSSTGSHTLTGDDVIEIFDEVNNHSTIHKGRKNNYVGTINPTTLANISGSVSDMGSFDFNATSDGEIKTDGTITYGNPFHDSVPTTDNSVNHRTLERMIVEFKLVPRE